MLYPLARADGRRWLSVLWCARSASSCYHARIRFLRTQIPTIDCHVYKVGFGSEAVLMAVKFSLWFLSKIMMVKHMQRLGSVLGEFYSPVNPGRFIVMRGRFFQKHRKPLAFEACLLSCSIGFSGTAGPEVSKEMNCETGFYSFS